MQESTPNEPKQKLTKPIDAWRQVEKLEKYVQDSREKDLEYDFPLNDLDEKDTLDVLKAYDSIGSRQKHLIHQEIINVYTAEENAKWDKEHEKVNTPRHFAIRESPKDVKKTIIQKFLTMWNTRNREG